MQDGTLISPGYLNETATAREDIFARDCPARQLLNRVGDKWSMLILLLLGQQSLRFSELKRRCGGVSQKMLSQTLRSLERDGLVTRTVKPTVPVTVIYGVTPLSRELLGALQFLIDWAEMRMVDVAEAQKQFDRQLETR